MTIFISTEAGMSRGVFYPMGRWTGGGEYVSGASRDVLHLGDSIRLTWVHPTEGVELTAEATVSVVGTNGYFVADVVRWVADDALATPVVVRERTLH